MNIGIYKRGQTLFFKPNEEDHLSWSTEVITIARILSDRGHNVYILSPTDLEEGSFMGLHIMKQHPKLDRIYVWNGPIEKDPEWQNIFELTNDVRMMVTDLALSPSDPSRFTHVYTQGGNTGTYAFLQEYVLYRAVHHSYEPKEVQFYFGGTERNRLADFLEYVWRPGHLWHGKSESLGIRDYVPYREHLGLLRAAKYTVVIGDEAYNKTGFVTPRYYECLLAGVIPFVDFKFDKHHLIKSPDQLLVDGYVDMYQMMKMDDFERESLLELAKSFITDDMIEGNNIYNAII